MYVSALRDSVLIYFMRSVFMSIDVNLQIFLLTLTTHSSNEREAYVSQNDPAVHSWLRSASCVSSRYKFACVTRAWCLRRLSGEPWGRADGDLHDRAGTWQRWEDFGNLGDGDSGGFPSLHGGHLKGLPLVPPAHHASSVWESNWRQFAVWSARWVVCATKPILQSQETNPLWCWYSSPMYNRKSR